MIRDPEVAKLRDELVAVKAEVALLRAGHFQRIVVGDPSTGEANIYFRVTDGDETMLPRMRYTEAFAMDSPVSAHEGRFEVIRRPDETPILGRLRHAGELGLLDDTGTAIGNGGGSMAGTSFYPTDESGNAIAIHWCILINRLPLVPETPNFVSGDFAPEYTIEDDGFRIELAAAPSAGRLWMALALQRLPE